MAADTIKRERPKGSIKAFGSLSRTAATYNSSDLKPGNAKRTHIVVDVTNVGGAGTLDLLVQGKDPVSGKYYTILDFAQITTVSVVAGKIAPGIPVVAGLAVDDVLPTEFRVNAIVGTNAVIFSVGINIIDE
ncbi:MAG: hypothetical protein V3W19_01400 [Desulfatiglandales bacterium]